MLRATGRACKTRPPDPFFLGPARPKPGSKSPEARGLFPGFFQEKLILYFGIILYIISYTMTSEYLLLYLTQHILYRSKYAGPY